MNVIPQGYPLQYVAPGGEKGLVIAWAQTGESPHELAPIGVADNGMTVPRMITGEVVYFHPAP